MTAENVAPDPGNCSVEPPTTPSGSEDWWPILQMVGVPYSEVRSIEARARLAGVPFQAELVASGVVGEKELFRALAFHLGVDFIANVRPESLLMRERRCLQGLRCIGGIGTAAALDSTGRTILLVAPDRLDIPAMRAYLARYPRVARHMCITAPSALRKAALIRAKEGLSRIAIHELFEVLPQFSARFVVNAWQGATLGALAVLVAVCLALWPATSLLALHIILSLSFLSCVVLRLAAAINARRKPPLPALKAMRTEEMPLYTVLVALYDEAEIVPDLLVALGRLVWPRSKLEIKLVCESDDHKTLNAIRSQQLRSYIEVIEVPPEGPRTKPKALSYALPLTAGELVVLYDAEDRPHPFQLVEAWQRFRESGEELACLQAPLVIANRRESWISAMFALEYSALFHGILPWLAGHGLVLPLGGTSNHFRRSVLDRIGGWDPCNVTEDADLGLRLRRLGYETDTITFPTYEDAPSTVGVWVPQRTRWFKGWAQTWLVHMRDVPELFRDLGPSSFVATQVLFPGMLLSAMANFAFLLTILAFGVYFAIYAELPHRYEVLLLLDIINIVMGYGGFLALGWWTLPKTERRSLWKFVLLTPAYWLLLSCAAWRALWQLYKCPHHWEKTPHRPRRTAAAQRKKAGPEPTTSASSPPIAARSRPG